MSSRIASFLCLLGIAVSAWSAETNPARQITVGPNDTIIPHIADGDTWQTTIVLTNLKNIAVFYGIDFKSDSGQSQTFNIVGTGSVSGLIGIIPVGSTIYISTAGTSSTLTQGYGRIGYFDRPITQAGVQGVAAGAGGYAIFRRRLPGQPDQEAVVPIGSPFDERLTIIFDNRNGFLSGVAILNPTTQFGLLTIIAHDNAGTLLYTSTEGISAGEIRAWLVKDHFPALTDKAGTLTFFMNTVDGMSLGLAGIGLRFNPTGAFTSTFPLRLP